MSPPNKASKNENFSERTSKIRLLIGLISVVVGFLAANLALFQWVERAGLHYLLGPYARYVCAYGGFFAMIFGAALTADFINHTRTKRRAGYTINEQPSTSNILKRNHEKKKIYKVSITKVKNLVYILAQTGLILIMIMPAAFSTVSYTAVVTISPTTIPQTYYLHRTDLNEVAPAGKIMNGTPPSQNQLETLYSLLRGQTGYFYSPPLPQASISSGPWHLYIWASTASSGKTSKLTIQIHIVSQDGGTEKALIGSISDILIDYGYVERDIIIVGNSAEISPNDRIRLTIYAQTGSENDPKGINFYYDGYGTYQTPNHETRLQSP